jgi:hypothetical protein
MASRSGTGRREAQLRATLAAFACALFASCASGGAGAWEAGRFSESALGGSIGDLAALEPGWSAERAPDATLAFRHVDGSRASWLRECRSAELHPKALGRALWIALPGAEIEESAAREVASAPAWWLAGRAQDGARSARIATITRVARRCEDSFLLVAPEAFASPQAELPHRAAFERWVSGFVEGEPPR